MRISEVMTEEVRSVPPTMRAIDAWSLMKDLEIRHLVVAKDGEVVGILSERDLAPQRRTPRLPASVIVEDLMSSPVVTVERGETVRKAAHRMKGRTIGCLPVTENGKLVGIVTMADLLEALLVGNRTAHAPRAFLSHRVKHAKQHLPTGTW